MKQADLVRRPSLVRRPAIVTRPALALGVLLLATPGSADAQNGAVASGAGTITPSDIARRVGVMAHDSMMGRATPSRELDLTAEWIAAEFRDMGLRGGGEGGAFLQRYPLRGVVLDTARSSIAAGTVRLRFGRDVLPLFGDITDGEASADLVLVSGSGSVGRGVRRAARGKHVALVRPPDAPSMDREAFRMVTDLRDAGALSVMVTSALDEPRWSAGSARALRGAVSKAWSDGRRGPAGFAPVLQIRDEALARLLAADGDDLEAVRARAPERVRATETPVRLTVTQRTRAVETTAPNVVAILEGSDPRLRDEYVVFSAHMDHIGTGAPDAEGDSIFNGADDDASGTATVMEVAEAMAALSPPPRRSTLFLVVSGEESGLWGSEWYSEHPTVPLDATVANLNADMVGRNWTDTIVAIGKEHSDLGRTLERVNAEHPELGMTAIDDLWPEERFYFRSDHFNFARKGVPILFFFNGTHDDYHGRKDEPERIDAEKASRIAKLLFHLGVEIANADDRPRWDPESYARIVEGQR